MTTPRPTLFDEALHNVLTAHGIPRTGLCKARGQHRLPAENDEDPEAQMDEAGDLTIADLQRVDEAFGITAKVQHAITRERTGGCGLGGSITLVCSCGWRGRTESESNDYMYTNLREQERAHLAGAS